MSWNSICTKEMGWTWEVFQITMFKRKLKKNQERQCFVGRFYIDSLSSVKDEELPGMWGGMRYTPLGFQKGATTTNNPFQVNWSGIKQGPHSTLSSFPRTEAFSSFEVDKQINNIKNEGSAQSTSFDAQIHPSFQERVRLPNLKAHERRTTCFLANGHHRESRDAQRLHHTLSYCWLTHSSAKPKLSTFTSEL